ncbi:type II secretion system protein [Hydrogenimonas cancrithermarum]|nr:prepilin-type N-terminal cleavage/methylation domain-containing protein [Hydrogenimonas cancrithermarum]
MQKRAFTIVELVFVIVIIGILAAVAIPKLNATRVDAKTSVLAQKIILSINEIKSHALASGNLDNNITAYSNMVNEMIAEGVAVLNHDGSQITIDTGSENSCLSLSLVGNNQELNLSVTMGQNISDDPICDGVQKLLGNQNYVMKIRGQLAKF